jgi:predicted nucleotidyltransferase component of viral defense system
MDYDDATLRSVQEYFGLPSPALVEKDFYVVKALAAIAAVEKEALHVRLVFGGGTALSRAHRLIRRMSEDIDLRIVVDSSRPGTRSRRAPDAGFRAEEGPPVKGRSR